MNPYGRRAKEHWMRFRPRAYAQIPDPDTFFTKMGERAAEEIDDLTEELAQQRSSASFRDNWGDRTNVRLMAEERILPQEILAEPEPDAPANQ